MECTKDVSLLSTVPDDVKAQFVLLNNTYFEALVNKICVYLLPEISDNFPAHVVDSSLIVSLGRVMIGEVLSNSFLIDIL